jgi:hypothetical protein
MSSSERDPQPPTQTTEITVANGDRFRVEGDPKDVEKTILDAARGSIMQLAWLTEAGTRDQLAVNPEYIVMLRAAGSGAAADLRRR